MMTKLTAALVREVTTETAPSRDTSYFDIVVPRFALRVKPPRPRQSRWAALYFIRYTGPDGRERRLKIGDPATTTLDDARKAARATLAIVDRGGDPVADKATLRQQWTVAEAVEAFLASPQFARRTAKVQSCDAATLRLHLVYRVGRLPIADIDVAAAKRLLHAIETDTRHNARKRRLGGSGAARKTIRVLSALLSWCADERQITGNPLIGRLRLEGDGERDTVLTIAEEYTRLFTALDELVERNQLRPAMRAFVIAAALTGMRRGELLGLRWRDVDLAERRVALPISKGIRLARQGRRTETVSLPLAAAAALAAIRPQNTDSDALVFNPQRGARLAVNHD
jgi:integrase